MKLSKSLIAGMVTFGLAGACGQVDPSSDSNANGANNDGTAAAELVTMEVKATWKDKAADILVVQDNSPELAQNPIGLKLYNNTGEYPIAYQNLIVRLFNTHVNFQLGIINGANSDAALWGRLKGDAEGDNHILKPDSLGASFVDAAVARLTHAPINNNDGQYQPFRALQKALEHDDEGNKGFMRKDAKLVVLAIGYQDESSESRGSDEMEELLDEKKGVGNWEVHFLGPPRDSCSFKDGNDTTVYVNAHTSAANEPDVTAEGALERISDYSRRNKWHRLVEASNGTTESICAESYIDFMTNIATKSVKASYFPVKLEKEADPTTFEIVVNDVMIDDWKYDKATQILWITTDMKKDQVVQIKYMTVGPPPDTVSGEGEGDDLGDVAQGSTDPAALGFLEQLDGVSARDAFVADCNGAQCHGGNQAPVDSFDDFNAARKAAVIDRINRADKTQAGGGMPRDNGGTITNDPDYVNSANAAAMINWITEYPD